ncbi:MAG: hypothetical protein JNL60_02630 [Bacteroidia bacterium]|nr:hypothetical protein [Bacteroidia bacterium]
MKIVKITLALALLFVCSLSFNNCKNEEDKANPLADSLKNVNNEMSGQLNEKSAALQEFIESFNEIQENLNAIKEKEKVVSTMASNKGDVKNKGNQIKEDIQAIYDLMAKNKNRIGSLSEKLKQSNLKLAGLEKMIDNLQQSLVLKDEEIGELKTRIEGLNIELANLNTNYKVVESESAAKTDALNTAYYAIGTNKELKDKKVISKEGGFIGLGKSTKVSADFNKEYFTRINIESTQSINIGAKKAKLLTSHPSNTYRFVGEKPVERIDIINPKEFWAASKYLVIVTD